MELDRKIREFPLPEAMGGKTDQANSFQRFVIEHIKETGGFSLFTTAPRLIFFYMFLYSFDVHSPEFFRSGYHRRALQSSQERLRTFVPGELSGRNHDTEIREGTIQHVAEFMS